MYKIWKRLGLVKTFDTVEKTWLAKSARLSGIQNVNYYVMSVLFLWPDSCPYNWKSVPYNQRIINGSLESEKIRSVQVHAGYLTISLKKLCNVIVSLIKAVKND